MTSGAPPKLSSLLVRGGRTRLVSRFERWEKVKGERTPTRLRASRRADQPT
jgi:hypothetical protein